MACGHYQLLWQAAIDAGMDYILLSFIQLYPVDLHRSNLFAILSIQGTKDNQPAPIGHFENNVPKIGTYWNAHSSILAFASAVHHTFAQHHNYTSPLDTYTKWFIQPHSYDTLVEQHLGTCAPEWGVKLTTILKNHKHPKQMNWQDPCNSCYCAQIYLNTPNL